MKQLITVMALVLGLSISISGNHAAEDSEDQRVFYETHQPLAGLYEFANEQIVIGLIARADIIYFQRLSTGDMRFMAEDDGNYKFRYSPTRNSTGLTEGRVAFRMSPSGETLGLTWTDAAGVQHVARRVARRNEEVQFENGKEAVLRGSLIVPEGDGPFPAVVLIPQADRTDLWDVGMWLFSRGLAVLAYDQRNSEVGLSTGKEAAGGYQDQQKTYAGDAIAAVHFLQSRGDIDARRVGVIGWSGGGFTGAMVAGEMSGLGFYVSIAGDASPGFEQASSDYFKKGLISLCQAEVLCANWVLRVRNSQRQQPFRWTSYIKGSIRHTSKASQDNELFLFQAVQNRNGKAALPCPHHKKTPTFRNSTRNTGILATIPTS